ncbi:MAG: DUF4058 family protein [Leptolyngbya sp. IPPAS B-1204]
MPNPFPGMNPYLEQPDYWSDFHNQLVTGLARALVPQLVPKYRVVTDKWIDKITDSAAIAIGKPDVSVQQSRSSISMAPTAVASVSSTVQPIKVRVPLLQEVEQTYIEVKDAETQAVITVIEVLSPANKRGDGRRKYEAKRQQILDSSTHLVEIDLLRQGEALPLDNPYPSHYRILVSRAEARPIADLYPFNLSDPIPPFPLPLRSDDPVLIVDLQQIVNQLYDQLGYGISLIIAAIRLYLGLEQM